MSYVDPYDFDPGSFVNAAGTFPKYRSQANQYAVFAEDRLAITSRWSVVGGVRYDHASVNRDDLVNGGAFTRVFPYTGWRLGTVFDIRPDLAVYGQYAVAADPVSSLLMLNATKAQFTLATGRQIEVGIKQTLFGGRADWTLAAYRIVKNNLVTADPLNPNQSLQVGQQSSRGLEATVGAQITPALRVDANVALLRARYDDYVQGSGGTAISLRGQRACFGAAAARESVGKRPVRAWLDGHWGPQIRG